MPDVSHRQARARRPSSRAASMNCRAAGLASGRAPPDADACLAQAHEFPTHEELAGSARRRSSRAASCCWTRKCRTVTCASGRRPACRPSRHFSYAIQWWGFAARAARALLRPQFSQGVLMQDSRAPRPAHSAHRRGRFPGARGGGVHALLRQALASGEFLEQGRAHRCRRGRSIVAGLRHADGTPAGADGAHRQMDTHLYRRRPLRRRPAELRWFSAARAGWRSTTK